MIKESNFAEHYFISLIPTWYMIYMIFLQDYKWIYDPSFFSFQFVAHPNCQQLLATLWYEGSPGFRRRNVVCKLLITVTIGFMFPLFCILYLIAPKSRLGKLIRKPFIKFICHSTSYLMFLCKKILMHDRFHNNEKCMGGLDLTFWEYTEYARTAT